MQSDHDALFRAILASPDDDPLRLVYADWLEEFGDPQHAHFIRVQVANAQLPPWDPAWIRAECIDRTTGYPNDFSVPGVRLPRGLRWQGGMYRRGFPSAVWCRGYLPLLRHGDELGTLAPVDEVEIRTENTWDTLFLTPIVDAAWFSRIHRLRVVLATLDRASIAALHRAENLTDLDVQTCLLSPEALAELFRPPLITRLRRLSVSVREDELASRVLSAGGPHRQWRAGREPNRGCRTTLRLGSSRCRTR